MCFWKIWDFHFHNINFLKLHFVEYVKFSKSFQGSNGTGTFICLYITWKRWNFIHKFPPMKVLLNIWWKSLHRNSRYCQNHQNGVNSCFQKMVINMKKKKIIVNHQNIGCKLLPKEEKIWNLTIYPLPNEIGHSESLWQ